MLSDLDMRIGRPRRVGVTFWRPDDGLAEEYTAKFESLGHEVVRLNPLRALPQDLDVCFVYGPYGSLVPIGQQLIGRAPPQRPALALLLTEQFPNPGLPEWVRYLAGSLRSRVERSAFRQDPGGGWRVAAGLGSLVARGLRFRYYGDLYWLRRAGVLSALAVWSYWTADFLRARGFDPIVPTRGHNPTWGQDLGLERHIPVLWLGKIGSRRRKRLLKRLRAELRNRGIEILMIDGQENPYVFEAERTDLLNRTKIMVNLLRQKWDDNSLRLGLAAHNGALVVSEPMLPHTHYEPGRHYIEAPIERMADTIVHYLNHEADRRRIADQAYQLVTNSTVVAQGFAEILAKALETRAATAGQPAGHPQG